MKFLNNLKIGSKLNIGFGLLVALTLVVIGLSYLGSFRTTTNINRTSDLSAPTALASARAQANLLRMQADVRGYLALGDRIYRDGYDLSRQAFEEDLATLGTLSRNWSNPQNKERLRQLQDAYMNWSSLPMQLFNLRDDQLQREPALRILIKEANPLIALIVVSIKSIIKTQQQRRELSAENIDLLGNMTAFRSSFFAMIAGLRGYVTTGRENFKFEYASNLTINESAWEKLTEAQTRLNRNQHGKLKKIVQARRIFLTLPQKMFEAVEGEHAREDLYLFRTQAVPLTEAMLKLLDEMTADQQNLLQVDLNEGRDRLRSTQWQILIGGIVALFVGLGLAVMFRENIAGPVRRLTRVTEQIGTGDLTARATVESGDEIGKLARTFNEMSAKLADTLDDLERRRKKQKKIAKTLHRQNVYLGALHDTTLGLIRRLDLTELLSVLITLAGRHLDTSHGYIYLVDSTGSVLERHLGVGAFSNTIGHHLRPNEGVSGKVWQTGEPLVVNEYNTWAERATSAEYEVTIRAIMGVPLKSGADVIGVLGMAYDIASEKRFGKEEVELLSRFAELASISLDNARLYTATQEAKRKTDEELTEADNYVKEMLPLPLNDGPIRIDWRFVPSASLGGDAFGYQWIDDDNLVVYLIDVSGHGVGAALLSVSILNVLRSQTLSETDFRNPQEVLSALNDAFPGEKHNDMFFTIWYGVYTKSTRTLSYASGGHPPALLFSASKKQRFEMIPLRTKNNVIGAMPNVTYQNKKQLIHANSNLFIFSDGVYEHRKKDGSMWRFDEFSEFMFGLSPKSRSKWERLHCHAKELCVEKNFEDDFTILEVAFE